MNCLEYVLDKIQAKDGKLLKERLSVHRGQSLNKSTIKEGEVFIFSHGYHVGFGVINEWYEVITCECSESQILSRTLSLYDERLKVVLYQPTFKRGKEVII